MIVRLLSILCFFFSFFVVDFFPVILVEYIEKVEDYEKFKNSPNLNAASRKENKQINAANKLYNKLCKNGVDGGGWFLHS